MTHHFSVDVEEYFQVAALADHIDRSEWDRLDSRVTRPIHRILELLAKQGARGTFFVVGWLAERQPQLVRDIVSGGHEIASHSWYHQVVRGQDPDAFRASARRSKAVLEDITGSPVLGFRAPCFSITPGDEWALDILIEEGYLYYDGAEAPSEPSTGESGNAQGTKE
jgi:polysaccharide deacetylase family protein (PEP-CTERM system associated)